MLLSDIINQFGTFSGFIITDINAGVLNTTRVPCAANSHFVLIVHLRIRLKLSLASIARPNLRVATTPVLLVLMTSFFNA